MKRRVALVTGGARGIARGIGLDLAARGWSIALCYRTSEGDAETAVQAIEAAGAEAMSVRADVSDPSVSTRLVEQVESEWGRIDALVNGAGPYHKIPLLEETADGWREMFDHNLHPVFDLVKAVAPGMKRRRWGRILSFGMANTERLQANPQVAGHYIAKIAIVALSRSFARVLAPFGITVNVISPGFIDSGSTPLSELEPMIDKIPAGRLGTVDDTVAVARFLLSDEAEYVSGANILVSGGWGL
jgi:3-oxoacyl-[acyl-carrier protein] reductase